MYCARNGSPGISTVGAKSPGLELKLKCLADMGRGGGRVRLAVGRARCAIVPKTVEPLYWRERHNRWLRRIVTGYTRRRRRPAIARRDCRHAGARRAGPAHRRVQRATGEARVVDKTGLVCCTTASRIASTFARGGWCHAKKRLLVDVRGSQRIAPCRTAGHAVRG